MPMEAMTSREATRQTGLVTVVEQWQNGRYVSLLVRIPDVLRHSHRYAGQYSVVTFPGMGPRFLAIASAPGASHWEFLVDPEKADLGRVLSQLRSGDSFYCSIAEGPGYPVNFADFSDVLAVATGSGVASIIPMLDALEGSRSRVLYAEKSHDHFAYLPTLRAGASAGRYALHLLDGARIEDVSQSLDLHMPATAVLLCGAPATVAALSAYYRDAGVLEHNIFTNL